MPLACGSTILNSGQSSIMDCLKCSVQADIIYCTCKNVLRYWIVDSFWHLSRHLQYWEFLHWLNYSSLLKFRLNVDRTVMYDNVFVNSYSVGPNNFANTFSTQRFNVFISVLIRTRFERFFILMINVLHLWDITYDNMFV